MDLREAILQVARHFLTTEPKLCKDTALIADYNIESHSRDHERYLNVSRTRNRRAKALLGTLKFKFMKRYFISKLVHNFKFTDFERNDDDELGFRKNDFITIISQNDEHCWVGELNGLRGAYFSAIFPIYYELNISFCISL